MDFFLMSVAIEIFCLSWVQKKDTPFFEQSKLQSVSQSVGLGGVIIAIEFFKTRFLWVGDGIFPEIWRPSESSVGDTV
jgi:hypothetical protein